MSASRNSDDLISDAARVVVVGNGMVGHRFCEELSAGGDERGFRILCFGEEARPAYDRVHLSDFFAGKSARDLELADEAWYAQRGIDLRLGERVVEIDPAARQLRTALGGRVDYDVLVLATGSAPFVPPIPGTDLAGVFVYRTIDDLEAIRAWGAGARRAAVIGGGLLGLEAAKAARDMGLETHVVEFAPRLMPRQVDAGGGEILRHSIERLGVQVHLGVQTEAIVGGSAVSSLRFKGGEELAVDMVIVSAGIRPRDELARAAGLAVGERGGIAVDSTLATSDPRIFCIGESALANGMIYGLVAPGYEMARTLAARLRGRDARFTGADLSAKLKLLGVEVASFGDAFADEALGAAASRVVVEDRGRGIYQKLVVSQERRLLGGVLVGDASAYAALLELLRSGRELPERPHELLAGAGAAAGPEGFDDEAQICSCNGVSKGAICAAIRQHELTTVGGVKACTRAGTGCGGCVPFVARILESELAAAGREVNRNLCEHFAYTRQELFQIVKLGRIESFDQLLESHGSGAGCEVCRPAVASILASTWNDLVLKHATIQDTNDRFLANIQRGGTYSVIPRVPGGEITPDKLIAIGAIARRFDLYCKITGGQRIDLLGARVDQLPDIWEALVDAGFESGHAYGKAMRTVKSCIGTTWCRYGVQDSTALAIRIEERYRGIRAPHKLKAAVSGCIRECAEAQSKDFGVIATEKGWNLYLCGNGGSQPRHADLIASDVDEETLVRLIDRFLIYYIQTANPLERTARWLERLDGGIDYLKRVIVDDALGICAQLERDMQQLVETYECEWKAVVRDPERRAAFRHFANSPDPDPSLRFVRERGQRRPEDWPSAPVAAAPVTGAREWVRVAKAVDVPGDGGVTVRHGEAQIAVFNFSTHGGWYACQAMCPHRGDMVLGRGLLGTQGGEPKVACPMHKKTFSLTTGAGLADPQYCIETFAVEERDGDVYVALPAAAMQVKDAHACPGAFAPQPETIEAARSVSGVRRVSAALGDGAHSERRLRAALHILPLRDAALAMLLLIAAIALGSGGFAHLDTALLGYLAATLVAAFGVSWRVSAFWRRPASAFYIRALLASLRRPRLFVGTVLSTSRDLGAQDFIRRRSPARWLAHLLLSGGTLVSFAITVPLVFGWMYFVPAGPQQYRMVMLTIPTLRFDVGGPAGWMLFHALSLAAVAVVLGAVYFLSTRLRRRRLSGATAGFAIAPLLLLLVVALTGLALPASRESPAAFRLAAWAHQLSVAVLLLALPFSKLGHVLVRPLQSGVRALRAAGHPAQRCTGCGNAFALAPQQRAVADLLAARGLGLETQVELCQACRRRQVAGAQAHLVGAELQPPAIVRPGGRRPPTLDRPATDNGPPVSGGATAEEPVEQAAAPSRPNHADEVV